MYKIKCLVIVISNLFNINSASLRTSDLCNPAGVGWHVPHIMHTFSSVNFKTSFIVFCRNFRDAQYELFDGFCNKQGCKSG